MVRHIVVWKFRDSLTQEQRREGAMAAKRSLEGLIHSISGIVSLNVIVDLLPGSNAGLILNSLFTDENALMQYQNHPSHAKAAALVASVTKDRLCADYLE